MLPVFRRPVHGQGDRRYVQRLEAAKLLLAGKTYEQIVKSAEISTATISRINRCIQYGSGGYQIVIDRMAQKQGDK